MHNISKWSTSQNFDISDWKKGKPYVIFKLLQQGLHSSGFLHPAVTQINTNISQASCSFIMPQFQNPEEYTVKNKHGMFNTI